MQQEAETPTEGPARPSWRDRLRDPMTIAVGALGITQITAWGTSYYCLGVLGRPIARDMGWSLGFVFLGFTCALIVMGLVSAAVGRAIDAFGARRVMSLGTAVTSAGLWLLSLVESEAAWLGAWVVLGLGMRLCLYDAAFAALVQVTPTRGRMAISYLTLFGAFASSIFWVVGHFLNDAVGWRRTLVVFALINLVVCLPLHWLGLIRRDPPAPETGAAGTASGAASRPALEGRQRAVGIALFAFVMSLNGFVFGVVSLQLVPLLEAAGLAAAGAVWLASLKGVAQFAGRVVEIAFGRRLEAMTVARIAIGVLPLSLALLLGGAGAYAFLLAFTLLMGASQGVISIVRGAVPLALFGPRGYGAVLGLIATPVLLVNAAAPTLFALMVDRWGWEASKVALLGASCASWVMIEVMAAWHRRLAGRGA